jgi:chromosome segregation ATPase
MIKNLKIALMIIAGIVFIAALFYLAVRLNNEKQLNVQINEILNDTLKEKEQLQLYIAQIEDKIRERDDRLKELTDVQAIKNGLISAQTTIEQLNKEVEKIYKERSALQEANISLNTRLQNTTKEFMRTMEELKTTKTEFAKLDSGQMGSFKRKIDELNNASRSKDQELTRLKDDLKKLQTTHAEHKRQGKER